MANRAQCSQVPLIVRLNMLRIDRGQPKSVGAPHCCDAFDVTAETAHLLIWPTLTRAIVAVQFVVLFGEHRVADRELLEVIWIVRWVLMVVKDCALLYSLASFLVLLLSLHLAIGI